MAGNESSDIGQSTAPRLHAWESGLDFIYTTDHADNYPLAGHLKAEGVR